MRLWSLPAASQDRYPPRLYRSRGNEPPLADDMGLGKTVQALAHILVEKREGRLDRPCLVVCPTSVVPNWLAERVRLAPELRMLSLHGPDRAWRFGRSAMPMWW